MNIRCRMQARALTLREKPPICAVIRDDSGRFNELVFIHPDHWDEAYEEYGDRLTEFWF